MTLGCGQGACCGTCQAASRRQMAYLTPPLTFEGTGFGGFSGPPVALETAAAAANAIVPGVGTAIEQFIFSEVKPIPAPTVGQQQMERVVNELAQQGVYVPSSISGLPEDASIWAAFGPQHKTLVMGTAGALAALILFKMVA